MYELDKASYPKARPLFQGPAHQPMCTAVLEGVYPGRVFVDDPHRPQTAALLVWDNWCFLVGNPGNRAFNQALNRAIFDRQIVGSEVPGLLLTCQPQDWGGQVAVVSHPREPVAMRRRHYVCRELKYDWRGNLPDGFTLEPMDGALLDRPGLQVPDLVGETLERWRAIEHPQFGDFGFVAVCGDEVAAWATVDFVAGGLGDVGMVTLEKYRRRGLAAVTTGAAVDYGLSHGLSLVNWTTAEDNAGSIRTAEKLGFERLDDYVLYYFAFDGAQHLAHLAYTRLQAGQYREAAELYERSIGLSDALPLWVYLDAAQAWAGTGERDKTLAHLQSLAERGWSHLDALEGCQDFEPLHDAPEWSAVLERVRGNRTAQTPN